MEPRLSFVTLAVADVAAARAFYVDGLGWPLAFDNDDVLMIQVGDRLVLSLWSEAGFAEELGPVRHGEGLAPITLSHNLPTRDEVDEVLAEARRAGASFVEAARERPWGGYSGYFGDPAGFRWEVCWNPGEIGLVVVPETVRS